MNPSLVAQSDPLLFAVTACVPVLLHLVSVDVLLPRSRAYPSAR